MKKNLLFLLSIGFVIFSCTEFKSDKEQNADTLKKNSSGSNVLADSARSTGLPQERLVFYYDGMIGKNLSIEVTLYQVGDSLSGKYRYTSQITSLMLKGVLNGKQYELTEYDPNGKVTGYFKGEKNEETQKVEGIWTNTTGKKAYSFYFVAKGQSNEQGNVKIGAKEVLLKYTSDCNCAKVFIPVVLEGLYPEKMEAVNQLLRFENLTGITKEEACECSSGFSYGLVSGSYNVEYNQNMVLSIEFWGETMGAYPDAYARYTNINLNTGRLITMDELFNEKGKAYITEKVNNEINERLRDTKEGMRQEPDAVDVAEELCRPRNFIWESLSSFSFSKEGFIVHADFSFPHFARSYDPGGNVLIPYTELNGMLATDSVLEAIVK